jgi:hypothetical protein
MQDFLADREPSPLDHSVTSAQWLSRHDTAAWLLANEHELPDDFAELEKRWPDEIDF